MTDQDVMALARAADKASRAAQKISDQWDGARQIVQAITAAAPGGRVPAWLIRSMDSTYNRIMADTEAANQAASQAHQAWETARAEQMRQADPARTPAQFDEYRQSTTACCPRETIPDSCSCPDGCECMCRDCDCPADEGDEAEASVTVLEFRDEC